MVIVAERNKITAPLVGWRTNDYKYALTDGASIDMNINVHYFCMKIKVVN